MAVTSEPAKRLSAGVRVGHWTASSGAGGCTVVLPPLGNVTSYDLRGSSPGSRELATLDPDRQRTEVHGILLTGGSAFGLAAADGVVRWLEEHDVGFKTPIATIPIVPAAVIFDLAAGDPASRPGPDAGYAACEDAIEEPVATGRIGAGAGATVGKWAGREHLVPGGLGIASAGEGELAVHALAVVNAFGDVIGDDGRVIAGSSAPDPQMRQPPADPRVGWSTVLAVVTTVATLGRGDARFLAARASDGITQAIRPAHTRYDGDVAFAVTIPGGTATATDLDVLGVLSTIATATA
ncbi:MAG: P1 family peptidase, partial [Chloroflexi bacterium]|nr:P1 family peptidase [Chloroflexota bacterium]